MAKKLSKKQQAEIEAQVAPYIAYAKTAKEQGCGLEQTHNFIKAGIVLQPKQLLFAAKCRECDLPDGPTSVMYAGGRGSSKSHAFMSQIFADDCQRIPGLKVLILRKSGKANKEQINDFRTKLLKNIPHHYKEQAGIIQLENGSQVLVGHFKDEKDISIYLGLEYDLIGIEEANQLTFTKIKAILSCLRTSKSNWRPRCYLTTNPGGVGHAQNKQVWYDPWKEGREKDTRYVHTLVYDNTFVNKEYVKYLESLTGWQRHAWLDGSWDFMAGAFFTNFSLEHHVVDFCPTSEARSWMCGLDYGFQHPTASLLMFEDKAGVIWILDEYSQNETVIEEHAENIRYMLRSHNVDLMDLQYFVAGKDCFSRKPDGTTIADEYLKHGIELKPAEVDRINGWARMQQLLGDVSKGIQPKLYIHRRCKHLIHQIQIAQHSEKRPGDIDKFNANETGEGGDDSLDVCRYILSSNPNVAVTFAKAASVSKGMIKWHGPSMGFTLLSG